MCSSIYPSVYVSPLPRYRVHINEYVYPFPSTRNHKLKPKNYEMLNWSSRLTKKKERSKEKRNYYIVL